MQKKIVLSGIVAVFAALIIVTGVINNAYAIKAREEKNVLESKEFSVQQLYISSSQIQLNSIINQLSNSSQWQSFLKEHPEAYVYIDPRSGRPVSLMYPYPLLPGSGEGNTVTSKSLSRIIGYEVTQINEEIVKEVVLKHLTKYVSLLKIDLNELGTIRITQPADYLWHISIGRRVHAIQVKDANISMAINHGNLVLWGAEKWGDVIINTTPKISQQEALRKGFDWVGSRIPGDEILNQPHLEIIPVSSVWNQEIGHGYGYVLAWVFSFKRTGFNNTWEIMVDALNGKVLSFRDINAYLTKKAVGSIYPVSSDECCPDGCADVNVPIVFDTLSNGITTNYGGMHDYISGQVCTSLDGPYVAIETDSCAQGNLCSSDGDIILGGANGEHDCTNPQSPGGGTFARRTCAVEVTHINRMAHSWLNLAWLDTAVTCNVNLNSTCSAWMANNTLNFYRSGGGCRNTGEMPSVIDHEWAHALDSHNGQASISNPCEGFSDIVSAMRLHEPCIGRGFWWTINRNCGQWTTCPSNPGVSYGYNCGGYGSPQCCTNCTGVRTLDYQARSNPDPETISNFTCAYCMTMEGAPCGKESHCESIPPGETGWDLGARDLQSAPFNYDSQTAFTIATKIILQGQNNVTNWYSCTCPSTASGCAATNAYTNWITADDDDGNINNGTPHMTAIYNAFNRHGIACSAPLA